MLPMRKNDLYSLATVAWFVLVIGGAVVVLTGTAEPYVSPSQFPGEHVGVIAGLIVLLLVGGQFTSVLQRRAWARAGQGAGLEPDGGGIVFGDRPDFSGTVRGRPVEAYTTEYTTGFGEHRETHTYTVVETELTRPLEDGFQVALDGAGPDPMEVELLPGGPETVPDDPDFEVVGTPSESIAAAIRSGEPRDALAAQAYFGTLTAGDASTAMAESIPNGAESLVDGLAGGDLEEELADAGASNASTVSHTTEDLLLDGNELRRQAEAVVAVADAVERVEPTAEPA